MKDEFGPPFKPYVPATLSEVSDVVKSMILGAPTFIDRDLDFPDRNIDSEFTMLDAGLTVVRRKLGEERYAAAAAMSAEAKALFAADQDDRNGKADEGRELLFRIDGVLGEARRGRVKAKLADEDGEVSGD